ncbi:MAG: tyrosine-type recombinase/integrase [Pseudomonadota bacterium]
MNRRAKAKPPASWLDDAPPGVRWRQRKRDGLRVWWEPSGTARALGFEPVELDDAKPTWSRRRAEELNRMVTAAMEGETFSGAGKGRTVDDLIQLYRAAPEWSRLSPTTQRDYGFGLNRIARKWGRSPVVALTKSILRDWYETLYREAGPHMAQHEIRLLSVLLSYAELREWIEVNPATRLRIITPDPRERVASWSEVDALIAAAEAAELEGVALAIALSFLQGQRQTDVLEARLAQFDGATWRFERSKARRGSVRRAAVLVLHPEVLPRIEARIAAAAEAEEGRDAHLIVRPTGDPYKADNFRRVFNRVRKAAARKAPSVADVQFRDLRRSFAWWSREAGASERDRADALGNTSDVNARLGQTYNPSSAEGAARAVASMKRPEGS